MNNSAPLRASLLLALALCSLAGCASQETRYRGWVGASFSDYAGATYPVRCVAHDAPDGHAGTVAYPPGVLVTQTTEDAPMARAGLRAGDVILSLGDRRFDDASDLLEAVRACGPGERLPLGYFREGEKIDTELVVGRESYRREGLLTFGLGLSSAIDLLPNPDFNLLGLIQFHSNPEVPELHSPVDRARGRTTGNSWQFFLIPFGFGKRDVLLAQDL